MADYMHLLVERMRRERFNDTCWPSPEEWQKQMDRHGFKPPENGRVHVEQTNGRITKVTVTDMGFGWGVGPEQVYKAAPKTKAILGKQATQVIVDDPHIPEVSEADRMWNLVVLAAR